MYGKGDGKQLFAHLKCNYVLVLTAWYEAKCRVAPTWLCVSLDLHNSCRETVMQGDWCRETVMQGDSVSPWICTVYAGRLCQGFRLTK